jgi:uncharacterized protein (DUF736 family)
MTIELVSEQKLDDEVPSYYIYLDGLYVAGSYTKDLETAQKYYQKVYDNPAIVNNAKIVLKSEEIVVSSSNN